ncbi:flavin reductase [Nocardioides sp. dk4132]|uniref:flavin reductase family protein n=1 Tax=unclassified Nocardioides TaxID=2615069 RepID=UPI0012965DD7|nr:MULTISPECIES: flavin reductase family protein [unclassified Nocardioides]MQW75362.1 flavin reductase [Nocardioides sp. dk4132]QGA08293.1 flavin reductase [Nocardioides sp. dk884]
MTIDVSEPETRLAPTAPPVPTGTVPTGTVKPGSAEMRRVMGQFASGVTVVTAIDDGEPVGFVCQSFASVSLDPPLVLFCAALGGTTWPRIQRAGRFSVNVLAEEQQDLCARFGSRAGRRFEGLDWARSRWGTPSLPGVLARVHCEIDAVHRAGDHDVVIGAVDELEWVGHADPMVFFRGAFRTSAQPTAGPR